MSAIPLGGYVKMADEREGDVAASDLPRAFNRQSVWKRIAIVAAGPIANLLLAVAAVRGHVHGGHSGPARAARAAGRGHAGRGRRAFAAATSSSPSTASRSRAGRTCAGGCCKPPGRDDIRDRCRAARWRATRQRIVSLSRRSTAADWEGNVHADARPAQPTSAPPLIDEALAGKPARARGPAARAIASSRSTARRCARRRTSPPTTNAQARRPTSCSAIERDGAHARRHGDDRGRRIRRGARSASPGLRLKVDPAVAERLVDDGALRAAARRWRRARARRGSCRCSR